MRAGVPLEFRRPKERKSVDFLKAENAKLKQFASYDAHVQMVHRVTLARQPTAQALSVLHEAEQAEESPRHVTEEHMRTKRPVAFHTVEESLRPDASVEAKPHNVLILRSTRA